MEYRKKPIDCKIEQSYVDKLKKAYDYEDIEGSHYKYDDLLCELLNELGFNKVVDQFNSTNKWYA